MFTLPYMEENKFLVDMHVRTYECDFQGIVNNSVYMNYLEYARECMGLAYGICAVELAHKGLMWVVSQAQLHYYKSLKAHDFFVVETSAALMGHMRVVFTQEIRKKETNETMLTAETITACVVNGQPVPFPKEIIKALV